MRSHSCTILAVLSLCGSYSHGEDLTDLNHAFQSACPAAAGTSLQHAATLDETAGAIADGLTLDDAIRRSRYRQETSMAATIVGKPAAPDKLNQTARQLFARFCQEFVAEGFSEVGQYRDGDRLYLVFARPRRSITADDIPVIRAQLLELVNQARSVPRQCGDKPYAAASPVRYSNDLARAAVVHAADMARRNQLDHLGSDGSNPGERISRAGFRWRVVGENLALGFDNAAEVVRGWLDSPVHCENIMDARFEDMGVAFAISSGPDAVVYWAQSLAAPASPKPARVTASR